VGINDFCLACSSDDSQEYCTYDNPTLSIGENSEYSLMFILSRTSEIHHTTGFANIEDLIERVISHETIHVVILQLQDKETSDKLDDLEILYTFGAGRSHIIRMNYLGYADDDTGLVTTNL
jgi:hypothetical protein